MKWFEGDVSDAIKKAITEKKLFIVFVKGANDESVAMEKQLNDELITGICTEENSVSINIVSDSVAGQQFSSIYPVLAVPSTYLINNDGLPSDIIPSMTTDNDFKIRLATAIQKFGSDQSQPQTQNTTYQTTHEQPTQQQPTEPGAADEPIQTQQSASSSSDAKQRAEELLQRARTKKAEKEEEDCKEKEQNRRKEGRELNQAKRDMVERQAKQLADEIAKRRAEDKAARERVKEQIRQDREDKMAKHESEKKLREQEKAQRTKIKQEALETAKKTKTNTNESRLQFRLPDGSSSTNVFPADANFQVVRNYVEKELQLNLPSIRLTMSFPRHEFLAEENSKSLRELGLVPNASIIVSPGVSSSAVSSSTPWLIVLFILTPIIALVNFIISLVSGKSSSKHDKKQESDQRQQQIDQQKQQQQQQQKHLRRRNLDSNVRCLTDDDDDDDDDDKKATWNGNSTQQM